MIRPFVGDVLVVCLIYCFLRIFVQTEAWKVAFGVLLFACLIEVLQYFDYVKLLGFQNNRILSAVIGRTFEGSDFLAYSIGLLLIILSEKFWRRSRPQSGLPNFIF